VLSPEPEPSGSDDAHDGAQTPGASGSEEETASEDGDEVKAEPASLDHHDIEPDLKPRRKEPAVPKEQDSLDVPPPRLLPFKNKAAPSKPATTHDEDETDDEL